MLSHRLIAGAKLHLRGVMCQRHLRIFAPALQNAIDPIQQLFLDKLREYKEKSDGGKKLVDPTPELQREIKEELERISRQHGGGPGVDMTKFPVLTFAEPVIDPINLEDGKAKS